MNAATPTFVFVWFALVLMVTLQACELTVPTDVIEGIDFGQSEPWPEVMSVSDSIVLSITAALDDGRPVTGLPVKWQTSDSSVLRVRRSSPPGDGTRRDSLTAALSATVTAVGRGVATLFADLDTASGFFGAPLEVDITVKERWISVSAGAEHTCAVAVGHKMFCWGRSDLGQLGNGGSEEPEPMPQQVLSTTSFVDVEAGWDHTCAADMSRLLYCWGINVAGELGTGSRLSQFLPTPVALGRVFGSFSMSNAHSCATLGSLKRGSSTEQPEDNFVTCWGRNDLDQLGLAGDDVEFTTAPDPFNTVRTSSEDDLFATTVSAGGSFACAVGALSVGAEGTFCWGDNEWGQLGSGNVGGSSAEPLRVQSAQAFDSVTTSLTTDGLGFDGSDRAFACGLTPSGEIWCWGDNTFDQLGNGTAETVSAVPVRIDAPGPFVQVTAGEAHACGLLATGELFCWGDNRFGQVGNGSAGGTVPVPALVAAETTFAHVSAGFQHTCALTTQATGGAIYCWGRNGSQFDRDGRLGNGSLDDSAVPVRIAEPGSG